MTTSRDMDFDRPSHVLTDVEIIETIDDNNAPQTVEHLSTAGECLNATSREDLENHTRDNNDVLDSNITKTREKRKRSKANKRKERDLLKNSTRQESTTEISKAAVSAQIEELMGGLVEQLSAPGECSALSSSELLEGHAQVDNNYETKEKKSKNKRKKKRKSTSDVSLPSAEDINGNAVACFPSEVSNQLSLPVPTKDYILETSDQAPASTQIEEIVGEVVEHLGYPGECLAASSKKDFESHAQVDTKLETKEMKSKNKREKKRKLTSDVSLPSTEDINGNGAACFPSEVSNQVSLPLPTKDFILETLDQAPASTQIEEFVGEVVEHLGYPEECLAASSKKDFESHAQVDNNLETKEMKSKKKREKKRKLKGDFSLPSTEDVCGNTAEGFPLEVSNQVPVPYLVGELAASDKEKEINTEVFEKSIDNDSERKEVKLKKTRKKKRKLTSDSSLLSTEGSHENAAEGFSLKVSNQVHVSEHAKESIPETLDGDDVNPLDSAKEVTQTAPPRGDLGKSRRKLLVLDINGILADIVNYASDEYKPDMILSGKAVFKRPFCDDFLQFCFENFDVGIWSSRTMKNVKLAVDFLMGELQTKLLFCWDQSHCTDTGFTTLENREKPMLLKELKKLWEMHEPGLPWKKGEYNESNTLLLDDSPYKALRNPPYTAIFPIAYCYKKLKDNSLGPDGDLRVYLKGLASAADVRNYVEANPFGQRAISNKNASWKFYSKVICDTSWPAGKSYNYQRSGKQFGMHQRHY